MTYFYWIKTQISLIILQIKRKEKKRRKDKKLRTDLM